MSVLMKIDKRLIAQYNEQYSVLLPEMNQVLTAYEAMGIGHLDSETLRNAVNSPEEFVFDKMTKGEPVTIMGFAVDKAKAIEIIVKPNGYNSFMDTIKALKAKQNWQYYLGLVEVDNNQVILSKITVNRVNTMSSKFAETEKEILIYNFGNAFIALAKQTFGENAGGCDIGKMMDEIINWKNDACGKDWEIDPQKIKEVAGWTIDPRVRK